MILPISLLLVLSLLLKIVDAAASDYNCGVEYVDKGTSKKSICLINAEVCKSNNYGQTSNCSVVMSGADDCVFF